MQRAVRVVMRSAGRGLFARALFVAAAATPAIPLAFGQAARDSRASPANLPETNPYTTAADVELGRRLFRGRCGHCHGMDGEGGRGSVLNSGRFRHGGSDRELYQVIRGGIPNTEMPGAFNLPAIEIWRMVAFVQQLGRQGAAEAVAGNAGAGALVYRRSGCAACHRIEDEGGFLGQDLSDVGARRAVRHLRESVVKPDADIPLDYRTVVVTTAAKQTISGIHLNEDEYSVHLRDTSGRLRSFLKRELEDVKLPRTSLMPAYAALSVAELDDLVAYLASLRPRREQVTWTFDRLDEIGGHKPILVGEPRLIDSPFGRAAEFDGVDDGLLIDEHPLAGARAFTLEAVFRPDGGAREQRFFHLSERDPATGQDGENRMLFEIRVVEDRWYLDSYHQAGAASKALINRQAQHPVGAWYHVASVYDGQELRNFVNGVQQGAFAIRLEPHGPGRTSVGMRVNAVSHFRGAVRVARFTRRALQPSEFLDIAGKP
jgi:putative heme-binding domain-containing protein